MKTDIDFPITMQTVEKEIEVDSEFLNKFHSLGSVQQANILLYDVLSYRMVGLDEFRDTLRGLSRQEAYQEITSIYKERYPPGFEFVRFQSEHINNERLNREVASKLNNNYIDIGLRLHAQVQK